MRAWGTPYLCQAVPPDLSRWHPSLIINSRGLCQAPGNGACSVPFSPWSQLISCQGRGRHLGERGLIAPASIRLVSPHTCEVDALFILPRISLSSEWSGRMFMATTKEEAGLGFKYMGLCPKASHWALGALSLPLSLSFPSLPHPPPGSPGTDPSFRAVFLLSTSASRARLGLGAQPPF